MSDVKRYIAYLRLGAVYHSPHADGEWVRWEDYERLLKRYEESRPPTWNEVENLAQDEGVDTRVYVQALHKKVRDQQRELARLNNELALAREAARINAQTVREQQAGTVNENEQ